MKEYKPQRDPVSAPVWHENIEEVEAIQALASGTANEGQQVMALRFIVECLAATYDMPYRPESPRNTDFASGKMWVGQQIVAATKMKTGLLRQASEKSGKPKRKTNG